MYAFAERVSLSTASEDEIMGMEATRVMTVISGAEEVVGRGMEEVWVSIPVAVAIACDGELGAFGAVGGGEEAGEMSWVGFLTLLQIPRRDSM